MKKTFSTLLFITCIIISAYAQLNIELLAKRSYGNVRLSNIWGWTAPDGTEYALVGTQQGVSIVSLRDPRNPREVALVPGGTSIWREIKTWNNHAYVVTDQSGTNDGLLIIDLAKLPDSVSYVNWRPTIEGVGTLSRSHALFIDENGVCYLFGSNLNRGGPLLVDVATNPKAPIYLGKGDATYVHDGYARNNILYAGEIYAGRVAIYDVSNKANVKLLTAQQTPGRFTHNTWLSDDNKYLFTTDEVENAPIGAYDISNLNDIKELDQFRRVETLNRGVVPHNVHVKNNYLVTSYYTDGVNIIDATDPSNLIEVGHYDTYPGADGGFNGAWGVYPYFPSGTIVVSDIQNGLYVLKPKYVLASRLEGIVTDSLTGRAISNVEVKIQSNQQNQAFTNITGTYKTGQALAGNFTVLFTKTGYYPKQMQVNLVNGSLTTLNVKLAPLISYNISGKVVVQNQNAGIAGADIMLVNNLNHYIGTADSAGNFNFNQIIAGNYDIYVGAWGYRYQKEANVNIDANKTITLSLASGYEDNFSLDLGWQTIEIDATGGVWERSVPVGTFSNGAAANPTKDLPNDIGEFCYVTGNDGGNANNDDVDGGPVVLISPRMDLTKYNNPILHYNLWFFNGAGAILESSDSLVVRVTNGRDTVTVEKLRDSKSEWRRASSIELRNYLQLTNNMKVLFYTSDIGPESNIVEAAVDGFAVEEKNTTPVEEPVLESLQIKVYPNPFENQLTIHLKMLNGTFTGSVRLLNTVGQLIKIIPVNNIDNQSIILNEPLAAGVYWLEVISADGAMREVIKAVKI
ncbi:MAG: choice-of-anchor B family protein [Saprospiraceae bacterium]